MRPARIIAIVVFAAGAAAAGSYLALSTADHPAAAPAAPVAAAPAAPPVSPAEAPATTGPAATSQPVVLADGRHPVLLKAIDPNQRTITFDLIQWYQGDDATREAAKDHQESPPPNDYYIRNVSPRLRTLPVRAGATITVNQVAGSNQNVPVTLARLAALTRTYSPTFWITVRHDQVVMISEQWVP
jgi:nucleoid-associated protein YgaU